MTTEMDWSHDFCLYCDKQTSEGVYCSQACRLADLEKAGASEPVSPAWNFASETTSPSWQFSSETPAPSWQFPSSSSHAGVPQFHLQPPVNFAAYRSSTSRRESPPASPRALAPSKQSKYFEPVTTAVTSPQLSRAKSDTYQSRSPSLYTSSSRSSLSSVSSASTAQGLSDQAITQLRGYSNSFDHVRDWKRRVTLP
jgi:hypothetical protein